MDERLAQTSTVFGLRWVHINDDNIMLTPRMHVVHPIQRHLGS
jgi:hypothetical protein